MRVQSSLKMLRNKKYLSITDAAARAGVPRPTYEKWERLGIPRAVEYAVRIADVLGVDVRELLEGERDERV